MYRLISGIFLIFVYKLFCIDILWYIMYSSTTLCDEVCQWPAAGRWFSLINLSQPVLSRERRRVAYEQGDRTRQSTYVLYSPVFIFIWQQTVPVLVDFSIFFLFFFLFFFDRTVVQHTHTNGSGIFSFFLYLTACRRNCHDGNRPVVIN